MYYVCMTVILKQSPKQSAYKIYCQKHDVSDVKKKLSALIKIKFLLAY